MISFVGLGNGGCKIAELMFGYDKDPQSNLFVIDSDKKLLDNIEGGSRLELTKQRSPEDYEQSVPDISTLTNFFRDVREEVFFVLCGSGKVSGATLKIMEAIQSKNINVVYIKPQIEFLEYEQKLQERLVSNVLREYALSSVFQRVIMFDNSKLEKMIPGLNFSNFFDSLNAQIAYTTVKINKMQSTKPVFASNGLKRLSKSARIESYGVADTENTIEKRFYEILSPREALYYFSLTDETLDDPSTREKVMQFMNQKKQNAKEKQTTAFGVFKSTDNRDSCFSVHRTTVIESYIKQK